MFGPSFLYKGTQTIITAAERATKVVFTLKSYVHYDPAETMVRADITKGLEAALTLYHSHLKCDIEMIRHYQEIPPVFCYPDDDSGMDHSHS